MLDPLTLKSSPNPEYLHLNFDQHWRARTEATTSVKAIDC
jgi:hypothetical protein